jgi:hypothetical protein
LALFFLPVGVETFGAWGGSIAREVQAALYTVTEWTASHKMEIAPDKSKALLITLAPAQSKCEPKLRIDGEIIPFNPNPIFLGITFDRQMTKKAHWDTVVSYQPYKSDSSSWKRSLAKIGECEKKTFVPSA